MAEITYLEKGFLQFNQLAPQSAAYNLCQVLHITGRLNENILELALEILLKQHDHLNVKFVRNNTGEFKKLKSTDQIKLQKRKFTASKINHTSFKDLIDKPFDLLNSPLLRFCLATISQEKIKHHYFICVAHHSILDFSSFNSLLIQLFQIYKNLLEDEKYAPNFDNKINDYYTWYDTHIIENKNKFLPFWQNEIKQITTLSLPTKDKSPHFPKFTGETFSTNIDDKFCEKIKNFSRSCKTTLFYVLLAAFQILLSRYSNQERITLGIPTSVNKPVTFLDVMGNFANPIIGNFDIDFELNFVSFLKKIKENMTAFLQHAACPFPLLLESRKNLREAAYPFFSVMFSWNQAIQNLNELDIPGIKIEEFFSSSTGINGAPYKLLLNVSNSRDSIQLKWNYSNEHFFEDTIKRMADDYLAILAELLDEPSLPLKSLRLMSSHNLENIIKLGTGSIKKQSLTKSLFDIFTEQFLANPQGVAINYLAKKTTYAELYTKVNACASYLSHQNILPSDIVAICIERSDNFIVAVLATLKIGAVFLPIDVDLPKERIEYYINDSQAKMVLQNASFKKINKENIKLTIISNIEDISFENNSQKNDPRTSQSPIPDTSAAYIIYTSGSTGKPKGAINTNIGLLNRLIWMKDYLQISHRDVILFKTSPSFDVSLWEYLLPLISGATLTILQQNRQHEFDYLFQTITEYKVTTLHFVPSALKVFLNTLKKETIKSTSLKSVITSGEALEKKFVRLFHSKFEKTNLYNLYGPTEAAIDVSYWKCNYKEKAIPIGYPIQNIKLLVLDKSMRPIPRGVIGDLYIAGLGVALGYINKPEATQNSFIHNPFLSDEIFYKTGDLAYVCQDGAIMYAGRNDRQIKLNGFRIELGEIESALTSINSINEAVVFTYKNIDSQTLLAVVGSSLSQDEIEIENTAISKLSKVLPSYMLPNHFVILEKLPKLPNGKIDYNETLVRAELALKEKPSTKDIVTTSALIKMCSKFLSVQKIKPTDNFFALGGNSLLAIQLVGKLNNTFKINLSIKDFYAAKNFNELEKLTNRKKALENTGHYHIKTPGYQSDEKPVPLTEYQKQIYIDNSINSSFSLYNINKTFLINGKFNKDIFKASLQEILNKHIALRIRIIIKENTPYQSLWPINKFSINILKEAVNDRSQKKLLGLLEKEAETPFDLIHDMLFRVLVISGSQNTSYVSFTFHHIISDGVSIGIFLRDLSTSYNEKLEKTQPLHDEIQKTYFDYALLVNKARKTSEIPYWNKFLSLNLPPTVLLPDINYDSKPSCKGESLFKQIEPSLFKEVEKFSRLYKISENICYLSTFISLLSRYTEGEEIVIGIPLANRVSSENQHIFGCFVNTLPFYCHVGNKDNYLKLSSAVANNMSELLASQDYPLTKLIQAKAKIGSSTNQRLFNIMYVYLEANEFEFRLEKCQTKPIFLNQKTTKADLIFYVIKTNYEKYFAIQYSTDLFLPGTICNFFNHYSNLLAKQTNDPHDLISQIEYIDKSEKKLIAKEFPIANPKYKYLSSEPSSIFEVFEKQAAIFSSRTALEHIASRITYEDLLQRINLLSEYLNATGLKYKDRIAIYISPGYDLIVAILSVLKLGATYVPLDVGWPSKRIDYIINDAKVQVCLITSSSEIIDYKKCIDINSISPKEKRGPVGKSHIKQDDIAYIIYTSGTTGNPKGVPITHKNVLSLLKATDKIYDFSHKDIWTLFHSIAFDFSVWEVFGSLLHGACLVIVPEEVKRNPEEFYKLLSNKRVTILNQTPAIFKQLIDYEASLKNKNYKLSLRYICFGGEKLNFSVLELWIAAHGFNKPKLINMYGNTECTVHTTWYQITEKDMLLPGKSIIGKPLDDMRVYILDKNRKLMPVNVTGELYVSGLGLTTGYLKKPEITKRVFLYEKNLTKQILYKTGDRGRWLSNGVLEYLGRADEQIKIHGYRMELGEILFNLKKIRGIKEVVLDVAELANNIGKKIIAYIQTTDDITSDQIRRELGQYIPAYMIPSEIILIDNVPVTVNGKFDFASLRSTREKRMQPNDEIQPGDSLTVKIKESIENILQLKNISIYDEFIKLGGDSISAIILISKLKELGFKADYKDIFYYQSAHALAKHINSKIIPGSGKHQKITYNLEFNLSSIQAWYFSNQYKNYNLWCQYVAKRIDPAIEKKSLIKLLREYLSTYDVFSLRFKKTESTWKQYYTKTSKDLFYFNASDFQIEKVDFDSSIQHHSNTLAEKINIEHGPLISFGIANDGGESYLLIAIHHLIVDMASWHIFLQGLNSLLKTPCTTSKQLNKFPKYQLFCQKLQTLAMESSLHQEEKTYWEMQRDSINIFYGKDKTYNTYEYASELSIELEETDFNSLNLLAYKVFHGAIQQLLLSGLIYSLAESNTTLSTITIAIEDHGRDILADQAEIIDALGWFTSLFPIRIKTSNRSDILAFLLHVKEIISKAPEHGVGYGLLKYLSNEPNKFELPSICFNHLGKIESHNKADSELFKFGYVVAKENRRPFLLEAITSIMENKINLKILFSKKVFSNNEINGFLLKWRKTLQLFINSLKDISHVYPLANLHKTWLAYDQYPYTSHPSFNMPEWEFHGSLNVQLFEEAWHYLIRKYDILRTSFVISKSAAQAQFVSDSANLRFIYQDWRHKPRIRQNEDYEALKIIERRTGFDLSQPCLIRVHVIQLKEMVHRVLFSCHQMLFGGWSVNIVVSDLFGYYKKLVTKKLFNLELRESNKSGEYIEWLQKNINWPKVQYYWQNEFKKFTPTACLAQTLPIKRKLKDKNCYLFKIFNIPNELIYKLKKFSSANNLTMSVIFQGAWALLLSKKSKLTDICFGLMVSGRNANYPNVDTIVGLLSNMLPVRIVVDPQISIVNFLNQIQTKMIEYKTYGYLSLIDIHRFIGAPEDVLLFDSLLNFQNYPEQVGSLDQENLVIKNLVVHERTSCPLSIRIMPGEEQNSFKLTFIEDYFNDDSIAEIADLYLEILNKIANSEKESNKFVKDIFQPNQQRNDHAAE